MNGFLLPLGMCTKVGHSHSRAVLDFLPGQRLQLEGAMVLNIAGERQCVGEDVGFDFQGEQENPKT